MTRYGRKSKNSSEHSSNAASAHTDERSISAFWCRIPSRANFGDAITPWLIRRITGKYPTFRRHDDPRHKYLVVGSILEYSSARCTVWGSGIMERRDPISKHAEILAVRGPLSRARAIACGAYCPRVYGDPALLLPRFYRPTIGQRSGVGIVAHYADKPRLVGRLHKTPGLRLIDIQEPIESVIDQICSCEAVASSSLHGLIASHAYDIPALWVKFSELPHGDDSKFEDYYLSIDQDPPVPRWLDMDIIDSQSILRDSRRASRLPDLDLLLRTCPFWRFL